EYDGSGLLRRTSLPHFDYDPPQAWNHLEYDALGRVVADYMSTSDGRVPGTEKRSCYSGRSTVFISPDGRRSMRVSDAEGHLAMFHEYVGKAQECIPELGNPVSTTRFTYSVKGEVRRITQLAEGRTLQSVTFEYDHIGRKTAMSDPNLGTWRYK